VTTEKTDPAAALEGMKRGHHHSHTSNPRRDYCRWDNQDWPCDTARLAAALEAVLKLADEAEPVDRDYGGEPIWWSLKPAEIREAVTRELTGEEPDHD
jgi:hypothetical protein